MDTALLDPPPSKHAPPKSPPMAFEMTSNDSLWAPSFNPMTIQALSHASSPYFFDPSRTENDMQAQLDKLHEALRLQHLAFVAERESWQLERERMQRRVSALESLLKSPNGQRLSSACQHCIRTCPADNHSYHSPARSPAMSPQNGTKPAQSQLPSIAEVDTSRLSPEMPRIKRDAAPVHIDLPARTDPSVFDDDAPLSEVLQADLPASPPVTRNTLSPPPLANRRNAGHTPIKAPRPGDYSPAASVRSDKLSDTPTRSNTLLNQVMSQNDGIDEDRPLKGPLHMPSLPGNPGVENFTVDLLDAKLKDISEHPEDNEPLVCRNSDLAADQVPKALPGSEEKIDSASHDSKDTSKSPSQEDKGKDDIDNGGIRLRTKPSPNFGAPLGSMGAMRF